MDENNVNQTVNESTVPEQPKLGWNWGAFMFNWIWGVGNRCYLPLLSLVPFVGFIGRLYVVLVATSGRGKMDILKLQKNLIKLKAHGAELG